MIPGFDEAFRRVIAAEGGYVNDPNDPGGETKFGISKRAYPNLDIARLTIDQARDIYRRDYWEAANCHYLGWPLALFVFDSAVNQGVKTAIKLLQKAGDVQQDGCMGPETMLAVTREQHGLCIRFLAARAVRYAGTPNFDRYGHGWMARLFEMSMGANS